MTRVVCVVVFASVCIALGCVAQESGQQCGGAAGNGRRPCAVALNAEKEKQVSYKSQAQKSYAKAETKLNIVASLAGNAVAMCDDAKSYLDSFDLVLGSIAHYTDEARKLFLKHPESDEFKIVAANAERAAQQAAELRKTVESRKNDICNYSKQLRAKYLEVRAAAEDMATTLHDPHTDFSEENVEKFKQKAEQIAATVAGAVASDAAKKQQLHKALRTAEEAKDAAEELREETLYALMHARVKAKEMQIQKLFTGMHMAPACE